MRSRKQEWTQISQYPHYISLQSLSVKVMTQDEKKCITKVKFHNKNTSHLSSYLCLNQKDPRLKASLNAEFIILY